MRSKRVKKSQCRDFRAACNNLSRSRRVYNMVSARRSSTGVIVQLEQRNSNISSGSPDRQSNIEKPDGSFEIAEVPPGSYTLSAFWFEDGRPYQARQSIEIGNANVEG